MLHPQHHAVVLLLGTDAMAAVSDHCLFLQLSGERLTFCTHYGTTGELIAGCRIRGPFRLRVGPAAAAIPQRKAGMTVIVGSENVDDCMADVIRVDGGAGNPKLPTLFPVADLDSGVIRWVCADLLTHIVPRV